MAKLDIKSAYRLLAVHPEDRPLLGFEWQGALFVDGMLPFGLKSAPKAFADAVEWIVRRKELENVDHYLNDFINWGSAGFEECKGALEVIC